MTFVFLEKGRKFNALFDATIAITLNLINILGQL